MNQFDKIFKQKLEHHTVDIPAGAWENISSRLPQNKRKNRPWLAFLSVFTTIMVAGLTAYVMTQGELKEPITEQCYELASGISATSNTSSHTDKMIAEVSNKFSQASDDDAQDIQQTKLPSSNLVLVENIKSMTYIAKRDGKDGEKTIEYKLSPAEETSVISNVNDQIIKQNISHTSLLSSKLEALAYQREVINFRSFSKKVKEDKACPFTSDFQDKSVDVYVSHDINRQQLAGNGAGAQDYISLRKNTETSLYSFSAGVRFGYNISYRWNLHTGFNYSQIGEKFQYVDPESNQTRIIIIKDYIYENGKIVDSIITEEKVLVPGTTKISVYNKYKMFDIPVLARYTLLANKYFSLSGVAGVYINVALKQKGMILNHDNNPIDLRAIDDEGHSNFKTQLGVSAYGSISLAYHLTNRVDFLLEPNMKIMTSAMTTNYYPLSQKYNTFGVTTGLRYRF
ncbi:MAG: outer membrane beta-barrel protein [Saprospiraceae bacterium]|jgi:hypothetical protein